MAESSELTVLVARFSALGDVAMTIPVLYSACIAHQRTRFIMVTRTSLTGMFVNAPANLTVVGIDSGDERFQRLLGARRLILKLIDEYKPDIFVDFHDNLNSKLMRMVCRFKGIRTATVDREQDKKRGLTRHDQKVMLPLKNSIERYTDAFALAGISTGEYFDGLYAPGKADSALFASICPPKPQGETWLGIAPFAAYAGKIYPPEKMEEVVKCFASRPSTRIFIFGAGPDEAAVAEKWCEKYPQVTSLASKRHGFPAELALLSHLDAMLTMDSGNMHLAAIAGTPTVSVWGATHSYCGYKAWRQSEDNMVQLPLPCRPCSVFGDKKCAARRDLLCLNGIRPERIVAKIDQILGIQH